MDTIRKEYTLLFNAITDAETALEQLRQQLICAQQQAEELFLAADEAQLAASVQAAEANLAEIKAKADAARDVEATYQEAYASARRVDLWVV